MLKVLIPTLLLLMAAMLLMAVKVLTVKGGEFPSHRRHRHTAQEAPQKAP